jgi:diguanylate cyclase (GGDEF)-like protein/PAS domain S-box-containing protein
MASSERKIMVVDNHPVISRFMIDHLGKQGHDVVVAEDALKALYLLEDVHPEIIFIDLIMPNIGGDQFCRILRSKPEFQSTYLIILSAVASEEQTDFTTFGADACIAKGPLVSMASHIHEVLQQIDSGSLRQKKQEIIGLDGVYQRQVTKELLSSKRHLEGLLAHIAEGILEITDRGEVVYANLAARDLLGIPEEQLLAVRFCTLFPEEERDRFAIAEIETENKDKVTMSAVPYGDKFLDLTFQPMVGKEKRSTLVVIRDISTSLKMKSALRESEEKYRLLFQEMINGFVFYEVIFDDVGQPRDYRFLEVNAAFETLTGLKSSELVGRTIKELFPDQAELIKKFKGVEMDQHGRFGHFSASSNRYFEYTLFHPKKNRLAVVMNDLTDRKRLEERLHKASITDELTGILNRRGFITLAEQQMKIAIRDRNSLSLLFADFDALKKINDESGHKAGDQALAATAAILRDTFRESDIIGRLGGDEFAILLDGPSGTYREQSVISRLKKNMKKGTCGDCAGKLSLSCGLARFDPQVPCTLDELISRADQQMYTLKRRKKEER